MPTFGSLFAGIGGIDLGLERAGWECCWQVENDPFCQQVLAKHWPHVQRYGDIRDVTGDELAPVDLICGGFPCQPVSLAGKRQGQADARWLWPEFARLLGLLRPRYVLLENTPGLLSAGRGSAFGDVLGDLARLGYDAEWQSLPAAAFGAPHLRYRVFIVAYAICERLENGRDRVLETSMGALLHDEPEFRREALADASRQSAQLLRGRGAVDGTAGTSQGEEDQRQRGGHAIGDCREALSHVDYARIPQPRQLRPVFSAQPAIKHSHWWEFEPDVGRVADGVPARVQRLRGLGNAVVPQVAEYIGRRILETLKRL